eukprot:scaffold189887_cov41-Prasinocladus_malaysianus.AAC.1
MIPGAAVPGGQVVARQGRHHRLLEVRRGDVDHQGQLRLERDGNVSPVRAVARQALHCLGGVTRPVGELRARGGLLARDVPEVQQVAPALDGDALTVRLPLEEENGLRERQDLHVHNGLILSVVRPRKLRQGLSTEMEYPEHFGPRMSSLLPYILAQATMHWMRFGTRHRQRRDS